MGKGKPFVPGQKRLPGSGRAKGTPNKRTQELAAVLEELKVNPVRALVDLLPALDEDKQADVYLKLMEYLYPKRKAVELSTADGEQFTITVKPFDIDERVRQIKGEPNE